ncbi:MAG: 3-oxoacyl-[acyl-carrier-protein] synthase III C-terminal domain-containing protein, partial [Candidatus Xenobia bacterium]
LDQVDLFVFHQANIRIVDAVVTRLGLDRSRVYSNLDRYGNTTAASIPIALTEAASLGRVHPGDRVMLVAFGAGFCWGGVLYEW